MPGTRTRTMHQRHRRRTLLRAGGLLAWALLAGRAAYSDPQTLTVGFSSALFADVNQADATASLQVWADTILARRGIDRSSVPVIFYNQADIQKKLQNGSVDLVGLLPQEFFQIENGVQLEHIHFTSLNGRIAEEYILLVRRGAGIKTLTDLQNRDLMVADNVRTRIGTLWLETLLLETCQTDLRGFFRNVRSDTKASRAVLSTFFGKSDACLVTRGGFRVMAELNPQLGSQLQALQVSPALIPAMLCLRRGYDPELQSEVLAGIRELDRDPSGQQILTVFRADRLVPGTPAELDATRALYNRYMTLKTKPAAERKVLP